MARAQEAQRSEQFARAFFVHEVCQDDDERAALAVGGEVLEGARVGRLDQLRLNGVQGFDDGLGLLVPATRRNVCAYAAATTRRSQSSAAAYAHTFRRVAGT